MVKNADVTSGCMILCFVSKQIFHTFIICNEAQNKKIAIVQTYIYARLANQLWSSKGTVETATSDKMNKNPQNFQTTECDFIVGSATLD